MSVRLTTKVKLLTLDNLDGRTAAARAARDLMADIESDLGGRDQLSTGELQLIQRACITGAILEDMETAWLAGGLIDVSSYVALGNAQRRYLETVGLKRAPRDVTPTLKQYLDAKHEAAE
jgi:hypothetical protein